MISENLRGLPAILREAIEIISGMPEELYRNPITDELEGFALMVEAEFKHPVKHVAEFQLCQWGTESWEVAWRGEVSKLMDGLYFRDYKVGDKVRLYAAPVGGALVAKGEQIYQARTEQSWAWTDISRDVYEFVEPKFRRIVYAAPTESAAAPAVDLSKLTSHTGKEVASIYCYEGEEFFLADDVRTLLTTNQPAPTKGNDDTDKGAQL